jgi:hypothetical protein
MSVIAAEKEFNTSQNTLRRYLENHIRSGNEEFPYINMRTILTVFSEAEGLKFTDCITTGRNIPYGLLRKVVTEVAYVSVKETS